MVEHLPSKCRALSAKPSNIIVIVMAGCVAQVAENSPAKYSVVMVVFLFKDGSRKLYYLVTS
jgi:hypothetical protein